MNTKEKCLKDGVYFLREAPLPSLFDITPSSNIQLLFTLDESLALTMENSPALNKSKGGRGKAAEVNSHHLFNCSRLFSATPVAI